MHLVGHNPAAQTSHCVKEREFDVTTRYGEELKSITAGDLLYTGPWFQGLLTQYTLAKDAPAAQGLSLPLNSWEDFAEGPKPAMVGGTHKFNLILCKPCPCMYWLELCEEKKERGLRCLLDMTMPNTCPQISGSVGNFLPCSSGV